MKVGEVKGVGPVQRTAKRSRDDQEEVAVTRPEPEDRVTVMGVPAEDLPPQAQAVITQLTGEVGRLKAELETAQMRMRELEAEADEDPLLPVLNRRGFRRELNRALAFARRYGVQLSLIYLDLNDFKRVNDAHGHAAGDAVLAGVASMLMANLRASDIVGRLGGDEFAAVLWSADAAAVQQKAHLLEEMIAGQQHDIGGGVSVAVGASAGAVELSAEEEPETAIARADAAMYARKAARRGGIRA